MDTSQTINHVSLCAGYGGIDLGLHRVVRGLRTVAACEIEAFAVANLVAKMEAGQLDPAPVWTDLKRFQWSRFRGCVDIVSGGIPCQPFSAAGNRNADEDPRHLFPFMLSGVVAMQPGLCFIENVEGLVTAKLGGDGWRDPAGTPVLLHILRELERIGYRATWGIFSAAEVGLPHRRKRVFILAQRIGAGLERFAGHVDGAGRQRDGSRGSTAASGVSRRGEAQFDWEMPRVIEPAVGVPAHGSSCRLVQSRIDELRLLGNGVVPATAARAFTVLLTRLLHCSTA